MKYHNLKIKTGLSDTMTSMDQIQQKPAKADGGPNPSPNSLVHVNMDINGDMSLSRIILFKKRFEECQCSCKGV